jgi:hemolysin activation/secretion protein
MRTLPKTAWAARRLRGAFFLILKNLPYWGAALLLASSVLPRAGAQDYTRVAPKPAMPATAAIPVRPSGSVSPETARKAQEVIVPVLKGLVFLSNTSKVQKTGSTQTGVSLGDLALLQRPGFLPQVQSYLGHALTFAQLEEITHKVVGFYRSQNHPLVNVIVPEQDVETGTVQVVVTEFRVGEVRAEGNKWFSNHVITAPIPLHAGETVDTRELLSALDTINANPFRHVNLLYEPGRQPGYTDLVLETRDRFPLRFYSGYDNSGTPVTGRNRWNLGVNWGNAFGHDQQLSYQFTTSSDFWTGHSVPAGEPGGASFVAHSLSWMMPLTARTSLTVFGAYERSLPNLGQDFGLVGRSGQASVRYGLVLPRTETFVQSVQAGYDFKITNNNLDFGGTQVSRNNTVISQFPVSYSATLTDKLGITTSTNMLVISPGGMMAANRDSAFQPAENQSGRPWAQANYVYWRSDLTHLTRLPLGATWSTRLVGQVSSGSLLSTEQLAAGGPDLLRGYDPYALIADQGIVVSNELRTPSFGHLDREGWRSALLGQTQFLGFWDYASLHNKNAIDTIVPTIDGSSLGIGLRYGFRTNASLRFDYGWQLQALPSGAGRGQLANISVMFGN